MIVLLHRAGRLSEEEDMGKFWRGFGAALLTALLAVMAIGHARDAKIGAARFESKNTLLRPKAYREWIFVGSSLGLRYDENEQKQLSEKLEYKNVYIDPDAYRAYLKTGSFPEGTVLVLETAVAETKREPGIQGSYQKEFTGLSAAVKDSQRFTDGWAYFGFIDERGKPKDKARPFPTSACFDCHHEKAAVDNVFTQYYPVLRADQKKGD
jgi:Cytochrome P460